MMIAVLGSLSKDQIILPTSKDVQSHVGGGVYYSSWAITSLQQRVLALPLLAQHDRHLLEALCHPRMTVIPQWTSETTSYLNTYTTFDACEKRVLSRARHFKPDDDFFDAIASCSAIHLSPLSSSEFIGDFYAELRERFQGVISLDGQGLTQGDRCALQDWRHSIDVFKVDEEEALKLARTDHLQDAMTLFSEWGIKEILVTQGSRGSLLLVDGEIHTIQPYTPEKSIDPTGCGDAYVAAYLVKRLHGSNAVDAARFASSIGAKNVECKGAISEELDSISVASDGVRAMKGPETLNRA